MTKSKNSETDQVEDISDTESTISGESFKIRVRKPNKKYGNAKETTFLETVLQNKFFYV